MNVLRATIALALAVVTLVGVVPAGGAQALALGGLTLYSAGNEVDGLPLTAVLQREGTASYVSFVYGDCRPLDDTGCAPPAEIQVWPACRRNLGLYGQPRAVAPPLEATTVRGVPAARLEAGTRLELQTGRVMIVVFAGSRLRVERIAGELRALDGSVEPGRPLPSPEAGALEGDVPC